ncbi:MAG TPA: DUF4861 family protein [Verrucomicrobiae bacterium]|nr:DUF4861 family protein [Verrucomicrobiae bacterium]
MNHIRAIVALGLLTALPALCSGATKQLTVKAVNKLQFARPSQTIELSAEALAPLGEKQLDRIHVKDAAGQELVCQAVDSDGDYRPDMVIFQADFAPGETKSFTVNVGKKQEYTKGQFKAFGRFVRERFDDFAWENDRIAHRMYGKALETWRDEPLASSTVDVWSKRVSRMVINDWYMLDNYHEDSGEGADFYSAGLTRGCGGNGLWAADRLWTSRNFIQSRSLANGPLRVMFELTYEPFDMNGISVAETKRITLDAGQNLDHFQSFYRPYTKPGKPVTLATAIGLKKVAGEQMDFNADHGWLTSWQDMEMNAGQQGVAIVFDPKLFEKQAEDRLNHLIVAKVSEKSVASYWAGFCWDKTGQFPIDAAWKAYVDEFAQGLVSPIDVTVSAE